LRVILENIGKKRVLMLLLAATEKEIEQALGRTQFGRQRHGANDGGSNKHAPQLAPKGQFDTQRLLHPTERTSLAARGARCHARNGGRPRAVTAPGLV
jgi:hypothetical protein